MSESVLKKEFREADLQRLRNLVQGKTGEKTSVSSGYTKNHVDRKEGEIWEEDSRQWTIKNGVKQTISKLQAVRDVALTPLFCPDCKALMKHRYDNQFYKIHRHCFDCHVKFETELKAVTDALEVKFAADLKVVQDHADLLDVKLQEKGAKITIEAISIKFADSIDESETASKIAKHFGIKHHIIEIQNLFKSYQGVPVLKGINLKVSKGHLVSIIGRSGCGKTTLLRCLNCLEIFDSGNINVAGIKLRG